MKRCVFFGLGLGLFLSLGVLSCKKKTQPVPPPPPSESRGTPASPGVGPAPTIEITASPNTVRRGQESVLTWSSTNADSVVIDGGVGNVATQGSVRVAPFESTTYTAMASSSGGDARASTRVTVSRGIERGDVVATDVEALRKAIEDGLVRPVFFAYDSAELSAEAKATIEENARWFKQYPEANITVEGHCDERGTEEYNLALGDRRALSVKDYLVGLGVVSSRLESISYGEERPFVSGHTESAWAKNRRAHFVIR